MTARPDPEAPSPAAPLPRRPHDPPKPDTRGLPAPAAACGRAGRDGNTGVDSRLEAAPAPGCGVPRTAAASGDCAERRGAEPRSEGSARSSPESTALPDAGGVFSSCCLLSSPQLAQTGSNWLSPDPLARSSPGSPSAPFPCSSSCSTSSRPPAFLSEEPWACAPAGGPAVPGWAAGRCGAPCPPHRALPAAAPRVCGRCCCP